eukprot:scaffold160_cov333-Pavlova_lutheri.AAC.4
MEDKGRSTEGTPNAEGEVGTMPPEAKKAKWEDQVDGETTTLYEIVQKATSAAAAEAEKYVDEKTRSVLDLLKPSVGPQLTLPKDYEIGKHLTPLLREDNVDKISYSLNVLNLLSFDQNNAVRLGQHGGVLPWLLGILEKCATDSLLDREEESGRVLPKGRIEKEVARSRNTSGGQAASTSTWWWFGEPGLLSDEKGDVHHMYLECVLNIMRNLSFNPQNWDHFTSPRALARILRCLDDQPLPLGIVGATQGPALDILENVGRKIKLKDIDAQHNACSHPVGLKLSRRPSLVLSLAIKNAARSQHPEQKRQAAGIISIFSESKLNEAYLSLMLMSEDVELLDRLVENTDPWVNGFEVAKASLEAVNSLLGFRGTLMKMTLAKKRPLLHTLLKILKDQGHPLLQRKALTALHAIASCSSSVKLLESVEPAMVELVLTAHPSGQSLARILHKMTVFERPRMYARLDGQQAQPLGQHSNVSRATALTPALHTTRQQPTSQRIGSLTGSNAHAYARPFNHGSFGHGQSVLGTGGMKDGMKEHPPSHFKPPGAKSISQEGQHGTTS